MAAGEADPVDEAAELALKHDGLSAATSLWLAGARGFALVHEGVLSLAVVPAERAGGRGYGARARRRRVRCRGVGLGAR